MVKDALSRCCKLYITSDSRVRKPQIGSYGGVRAGVSGHESICMVVVTEFSLRQSRVLTLELLIADSNMYE